MKREIKFRAWIPDVGWLADGFSISMDGKEWYDDNGYSFPLSNIELMQFTGLRDKNGKEIYEGDIVTYDIYEGGRQKKTFGKSIVEYAGYGYAPFINSFTNEYDSYYDNEFDNYEVIGNIYENPELIKQT